MTYEEKYWNVGEEMWKRKAKSLEDQYQRLLSEHQSIRIEKAKLLGELRALRQYKKTAEDVISKESAARRIERKDNFDAQAKLERLTRIYEEEAEKAAAMERENEILREQISCMRCESLKSQELLYEVEAANLKVARLRDQLNGKETIISRNEESMTELTETLSKAKKKSRQRKEELIEKTKVHAAMKKRIAALEASRDLLSTQKDNSLREAEKTDNIGRQLEVVKSESKQAQNRIHALDIELTDLQCTLQQRDSQVQALQESNANLNKDTDDLQGRVDDLSMTISALHDLVSDKDRELERMKELYRCAKTESGYTNKIDHFYRERIDRLIQQIEELEYHLLDARKDFQRKSTRDELSREKQRARDREDIRDELKNLYKPRRCRQCKEMYTNAGNATRCTYHSGQYGARPYHLLGHEWSCCRKRELSARPCKSFSYHIDEKGE